MQLNTNSAAYTQKGTGSRYASPEVSNSYNQQEVTPQSSNVNASFSKNSKFEGIAGFDGKGGYHGGGGHGGNQIPISNYSRQTSKTGERIPTDININN